MLLYQILVLSKVLLKIINLKYQLLQWNEEFELPDVSYCISDILHCFEYIIRKHKTFTDIPLVRIYINKREVRITFKIKARYYLELFLPETRKILKSTKSKITKDKMVKICLVYKLLM